MKLSERYRLCKIKPEHEAELQKIVKRIMFYKQGYADKAAREMTLRVHSWVFSIIQEMECGSDFTKHMHNGDPLSSPTVRGPAGRPPGWLNLPKEERTWERSAVDAARYDGLDKIDWNDLDAALYRIESYNGPGYRNKGLVSPYLFSYTNQYIKGKFIEVEVSKDKFKSVYKPELVSKQPGVVAIMKTLGLFA